MREITGARSVPRVFIDGKCIGKYPINDKTSFFVQAKRSCGIYIFVSGSIEQRLNQLIFYLKVHIFYTGLHLEKD